MFHLRILCYLYLKAFSIHDFKSVLFVSSQDTILFIFFRCIQIHEFKSMFVPPQDTMLFIFFRRFQFMILNQCRCSISGYYVIYIFQAFSIHNLKPLLCIPSQDTMVFIFSRRFESMILNQWFLFHLRILWYLYFFQRFQFMI